MSPQNPQYAQLLRHFLLCPLLRYEQPLALLGLYWATTVLLHTVRASLRGIHYHVLAPWCPRSHTRDGRWAVVFPEPGTLSYGYAAALAKKGLDILLVGARTEHAYLNAWASRLQRLYKVSARAHCYNLARPSAQLLTRLQEEIDSLDGIGWLVTQTPDPPPPTPHTSLSRCMVGGGVRTITLVTHFMRPVLNKMIRQGGGTVVNISDPSGAHPHPYRAAHSAACAYVDTLTRAVAEEVRGSNIRVQSLRPYPSCLHQARFPGDWDYGFRGYLASWVPGCVADYWRYWSQRPECSC